MYSLAKAVESYYTKNLISSSLIQVIPINSKKRAFKNISIIMDSEAIYSLCNKNQIIPALHIE